MLTVVASNQQNSPIDTLKKGQMGIISHFSDDQMATKLMAMGILPGSVVTIIRSAPFGGGFYVKIDTMVIALRKQEARCIILK